MRALISRAASAERWARVRTSPATTAKPRPCSPARAASTAALSARMLVWKAMPSMVPMMSEILREEALISSMVETTWRRPRRRAGRPRRRRPRAGWPGAPSRRCCAPSRSAAPSRWRSAAGCSRSARCGWTDRGCPRRSRCWRCRCCRCSSAPGRPACAANPASLPANAAVRRARRGPCTGRWALRSCAAMRRPAPWRLRWPEHRAVGDPHHAGQERHDQRAADHAGIGDLAVLHARFGTRGVDARARFRQQRTERGFQHLALRIGLAGVGERHRAVDQHARELLDHRGEQLVSRPARLPASRPAGGAGIAFLWRAAGRRRAASAAPGATGRRGDRPPPRCWR